MKTSIRIFAMTVALTGLVTSSFSSASTPAIPSHLSGFALGPGPDLPIPTCGPGVPDCAIDGTGNLSSSF